jgi:putative tryptophan/tyrosine transport system substrate-binding protein
MSFEESRMRRRDFMLGIGGVVAMPIVAHAQATARPLVGFLSSRSPTESEVLVEAFRRGLREAGFVEGQSVEIIFRWAEGRYDRLPALANELVGLRVAVLIAAGGTPTSHAVKGVTATTSVVFPAVADPIGSGLVASLNRPGGNFTGMSAVSYQLVAKRLELLKELIPSASVIAYLTNPTNPSQELELKEVQTAARALQIQLHILQAGREDELDSAFADLAKLRAHGLVVATDPFFDSQRTRVVALSARHGIATSYTWREYVMDGGLMSYGASLPEMYRQAGIYAGRILKGEKPADLPVAQPTHFHLALNLRTAKALGLTVSQSLLARADEVIE